ncbi:hypothetical protein B5C34_12030 [Pacificimonas flava]|uniref:Uncharacterized protein n=2 Tax=Pacificimonas TaxID=1960290 RepID=A0A219B6X8_9SPHN|nr:MULTISPECIES: hypothetical protein [Pacificimonas]MBZ6378607.1 hypothetical protein [Pacificimonas aurantium]OWV34117.1 hypothetical protein B5C34_12030 [Pacificimonas flava]
MRRTLIAIAAIAVATLNVGLAVGPAHAEEADVCATMPADLRAAAAAADETDARRALRKIDVGVALCEAGNERAAKKQFSRAMRYLDVTETELAQKN